MDFLLMGQGGLVWRLEAIDTVASEADDFTAGPELQALSSELSTACELLGRVFDYEKNRLFPEIAALEHKTSLSPCRAGMTGAHVRWVMQQHSSIQAAMDRLRAEAQRRLSPAGPCESCHELLTLIDGFMEEHAGHVHEEQRLFSWALAREEALAGPLR